MDIVRTSDEARDADKNKLLLRIYHRHWLASKVKHNIDFRSIIHDFRNRAYAEDLLGELASEGLIQSGKYPVLTGLGYKVAFALKQRALADAVGKK